MSSKVLVATIGVLAALGASVGAGTGGTEPGSARAGAFDAVGADAEGARTAAGRRDGIVPEHVRGGGHGRDGARRHPRPRVLVVNGDDDYYDDRCTARHCNLREAIRAANASGRGGEIRFALPAFPYRIELRSPLPPLRGRVVVDGASQEGAECPLPVVQLDGAQIAGDGPAAGVSGARVDGRSQGGANGLEVRGDRNLVRGLVVSRFPGHGIVVDGSDNRLECLLVGTDSTGTEARGNGGHGIAVVGGHSNRVGGDAPENGNLLAANGGYGLYIEDALDTHRAYNAIGVNAFGEPRLPNGDAALPSINPPPAPSAIGDPRALARVTAILERRVARLLERNVDALEQAGLYERYVERITRDPTVPPASDLFELIAMLALHPELYTEFTRDAQAVLAATRAETADALERLRRATRRTVPSFGRDALESPEDRRDALGELLATFADDDYVLSTGPSEIVAVATDPGPILVNAILWHSLETYGPLGFNTQISSIPTVRVCQGLVQPCHWPIGYDFLPWSAQLLWASSTLTAQEMEAVVQEDDYYLELRLNGQLLVKGPPPGTDPGVPLEPSYYAATVPGGPCPSGQTCLATNLFVRDKIGHIAKPWTFELTVKKLEELDNPVIVDVDPNGNPIIATHEFEVIGESARTVLPNPATGSQSWFAEALVPTFKHPRCADCHGFGTFSALAQHHNYSNVDNFVASTNLHLEPSAYVPGAHVMACTSCHIVPATDSHGVPFHELEWIAPYFDLDIDWSQKNGAQICARVKANLPTKALRHEHFHGDGRLFWAIEVAYVPGMGLQPAPPNDFDEFLRRVDLWNYFGAPCP